MSVLTLQGVSQSFGHVDLFRGVSGSIPHGGKIGLVGPNGIGKTTLLHIIVGHTKATEGNIIRARQTQIGYLRQEAMQAFRGREETSVYAEMLRVFDHLQQQREELRQMEADMATAEPDAALLTTYSQALEHFERQGGYDFEQHIKRTLEGLGFSNAQWDNQLQHLSGGQKTRALLARLLLEQPDLLVLDEPTNHLDIQAVEWLEGRLRSWDGACLIVSHDRYFLDKVVDTIWEMAPTGLESYRGNYSAYVMQREERWTRREKEFEAVKARLEKELDYIKKNIAGQRTQMAQGKLSRLTRDLAAIEVGGIALLNTSWSQTGLDRQRPLAVAEAEAKIKRLPRPSARPKRLNLRLQPQQRSGNIVLRTTNLIVGYPQAPLFHADDIQLNRQAVAALIGPNGSGKTTFLKTILEQMPPLSGEVTLGASLQIGYFSQAHDALDLNNTILEELQRHHPMLISEARSYLGQYLFSGDDVEKKISTLSGGERGRLALALLSLNKANFLLLDEPTNHLDIHAQEQLQQVLEGYTGTILMVSHDRYLIDQLATQIWALEDKRLAVFEGGYQHYVAAKAAAAEANGEAAQALRRAAAAESADNQPVAKNGLSKNERARRQRAVAQIEEQIHALEEKIAEIEVALQAASTNGHFDKIQTKSIEYENAQAALEQLMVEWEERLAELDV